MKNNFHLNALLKGMSFPSTPALKHPEFSPPLCIRQSSTLLSDNYTELIGSEFIKQDSDSRLLPIWILWIRPLMTLDGTTTSPL